MASLLLCSELRSSGHCPCPAVSIRDETGWRGLPFTCSTCHYLILSKLTTLGGFWEKETSGRSGRLTLLFPECVLGPSRSGPFSNHPTLNAQRSEDSPKSRTEPFAVTSKRSTGLSCSYPATLDKPTRRSQHSIKRTSPPTPEPMWVSVSEPPREKPTFCPKACG